MQRVAASTAEPDRQEWEESGDATLIPAQYRAILVKVFIQPRAFKGDPLPERSKFEYLNLGGARCSDLSICVSL